MSQNPFRLFDIGGGTQTRKCFNGYNYYVLGWHEKQTNEIVLEQNIARKYNIKGINHVSSGGIVNIKVGNYFITFNLKQGINGGVDNQGGNEDYTDEVIIHEGRDIKFGQTISAAYANTILVSSLKSSGDIFTVPIGSSTLRIKLCSIDKSGTEGAMLSIGLDATNCNKLGAVHYPKGMQLLADGIAVSGLSGAKNEILEFKMAIPHNPDAITCSTSGGTGDVDLIMNFLSSPQILYSTGVNAVGDTPSDVN